MNVLSFVSRWSHFEVLIATFRLLYCYSSSGDKVDCLRVAICSMLVRCYWCISILVIIPTRCCSLIGPFRYRSAVVFLDRRHPYLRNFYPTLPVDDVIRMKSRVHGLFNPTGLPLKVLVNKLNLVPNRKVPVLVACSETAEVWVRASRMSLSCSFILGRD